MTRWLMRHDESDSLFEVFKRSDVQHCTGEGCDDVTGMVAYEKQFKLEKEGNVEKTATRRKVVPSMAELEVQAAEEPLHLKYRPKHFADIVGQAETVRSLMKAVESKNRPHAYLFTGPSGTGKTTLARILASKFECDPQNVVEVDAGSTTGVDDMRKLLESLQYRGFGRMPNKMYILDECHMLSKAAWNSLLKSIEEPPPHVYFVLCTTEENKVPNTAVTRCQSYALRPLRNDDMMDLLEQMARAENMQAGEEILKLVAKSSKGSPRLALTMLAKVAHCEDPAEAAVLLEDVGEVKEVIDLARALVRGGLDWRGAQSLVKAMGDQNPESVRIIITNYTSACLSGCTSKEVPRLLDLLAAFSKPCNTSDKWAPIWLAVGDFLGE